MTKYFLILLCFPLFQTLAYGAADPNKILLEKEVAGILKMPNVDQRSKVDKIFKLGDIYNEEKNLKQAVFYYTKGLQVEAWNVVYQLKLAELLKQDGKTEQAREKGRLVYDYAEHEDLIQKAGKLLVELNADPGKTRTSIPDTVTIGLVPIGTINKILMEEAAMSVQEKIKVNIIICESLAFAPGKVDRSYAENHIDNIYQKMQKRIPPEKLEMVKTELQMKDDDLKNYLTKKKLVQYVFLQSYPESEYQKFNQYILELEQDGQYDAGRLTNLLAKRADLRPVPNVAGYVGVTEVDIYSNDYNFLYGWHSGRDGVMSYHRFTADFNGTQPERPKLRERFAKQLISSIFHAFGIPRCTSPLCARAYPHNLEEQDKKTTDICPWCREQLAVKISNYKK